MFDTLTLNKSLCVLLCLFCLQYLQLCNQVYMMKDGRICCRGTHDELMETEQDYVSLVNAHSSKAGDQAQ